MPDQPIVTRRRKSPQKQPSGNDNVDVSLSESDRTDESSDFDDEAARSKNSPKANAGASKVPKKTTDDYDDKKNDNRPRSANTPTERSIRTKYSKGSMKNSFLSAAYPEPTPSPRNATPWLLKLVLAVVIFAVLYKLFAQQPTSASKNTDWRSNVDPHDALSEHQQFIVRASMKAIMDEASLQEGVSTLLILSSDEESAAKLARCLLGLVNKATHEGEIPTEIDLRSHRGGKVKLDRNLRTLLSPGGTIRAVLLRHIDDQTSTDAFERARLLFAYCDGENPVVPHRLIIMTATTTNGTEDELRETFKTHWPKEHDFVDALMSRISGHTLFVDKEQKSIC